MSEFALISYGLIEIPNNQNGYDVVTITDFRCMNQTRISDFYAGLSYTNDSLDLKLVTGENPPTCQGITGLRIDIAVQYGKLTKTIPVLGKN